MVLKDRTTLDEDFKKGREREGLRTSLFWATGQTEISDQLSSHNGTGPQKTGPKPRTTIPNRTKTVIFSDPIIYDGEQGRTPSQDGQSHRLVAQVVSDQGYDACSLLDKRLVQLNVIKVISSRYYFWSLESYRLNNMKCISILLNHRFRRLWWFKLSMLDW